MDNDNNNQNTGFLQNNTLRAHVIHDLIHDIAHPLNVPVSDNDISRLPASHPLSLSISNRDGENNAEMTVASDSHTVSHNAEDVDMAPQINSQNSALLPGHVQDDDDESLPDLRSVSSSSDGGESSMDDADEVEMMQNLNAVDDDNDSAWTDDDPAHNVVHTPQPMQPHPEPSRNNRRARVDDDEDEDRDRRHPSQRAATPADPNNNQPHPTAPSPLFHIPAFVRIVSGSGNQATADSVRVFQRVIGNPRRQNPNPTPQNNNNNPNNNQQNPLSVPIFAGGFTVTLGTGGPPGGNPNENTMGTPLPNPTNPPGQPPPAFNGGGGGDGARPLRPDMVEMVTLADIVGRFGAGLGQLLGFENEKEPEDAERAKKLIDGLEEVPIGLVKRLERVGGAPGGHVDGSDGSVIEAPGCAICWDSLLDAESDGFAKREQKEENQPASEEGAGTSAVDPSAATQLAESPGPIIPNASLITEEPTPSSSTSPPPNDSSNPTIPPKIVCLPCSHVFHATCLVPWFSRPRQTTCPTCRFNIDPEDLTYVRRRPTSQSPTGHVTEAGVIVVTTDAGTDDAATQGADNAGPANTPNVPETTPAQTDANTDVPPAPASSDAPAAATNQTTPPTDANPPDVGGFWTFGFDVVLEQQRENERGTQEPQGDQEADRDVEMANDEQPDQGREPRRDTEEFTQRLFDGFGFTMPPRTDAGNNEPPATTGGDGEGIPPPHPIAGFARMLAGAIGARNGTAGVHVFPPPWMAGGANRAGPAPAETPPPAPPGGPPPADAAANVLPVPGWGEFAQIFGIAGNGPLPPQNITVVQGIPTQTHAHPSPQDPPREKRPWSPPPPPGLTLRQRVEQKEREVGLRCFDMSCGIGPSDEEPWTDMSNANMKQLRIRSPKRPSSGVATSVCPHKFHPACLVSTERVAFGAKELDGDEVGVSCAVCRAVGCITTEEWLEGAEALG